MKRITGPFPLLLIVAGLFTAAGVSARQAQGSAEISSPDHGSTLAGIVQIMGSASPPRFQSYSLGYASEPISVSGWTHIVPPQTEPVASGLLAEWDTAELERGNYQLRLIVQAVAGDPLIRTISDLRIERSGPADSGSSLPAGSPTGQGAEVNPGPAPGESVLRILAWGAGMAVLSLVLFGAYSRLRPAFRDYIGRLRTRRLHRRRRSRHSQDEPRA